MGKYQIENVSLQSNAAWVTLRASADTSDWRTSLCSQYRVTSDSVFLRCEYSPIGTVTIEGRFFNGARQDHARNRTPAVAMSTIVTVEKAHRVIYRGPSTFTPARASY